MHVALTGGTGFVGGAVLRHLVDGGHTVTALVRSDTAAEKVRAAGATPAVGDLTDVAWTAEQFAAADAAVHTASPGDASSPDFDRAVVTAAGQAFTGTGKVYVHTGGVWVWGNKAGFTETDAYDPPALTAWRQDVEQLALGIDGARTALVAPGIVYGDNTGIPAILVHSPRTDGGLHTVGSGEQHWSVVHVDDLADLYVRVLTTDSASGTYIGVSGENPVVGDLSAAASRAAGLGGTVVPETDDATRERLGNPLFADALLIDQQGSSAKAQQELGWAPSAVSLADDLEKGSYAPS